MSVAESIRTTLGSLSPSERRVARAVLADYPRAGLVTSAELATRCGVSAPTVIRFARTLGYSGFPDFQASLRDELSERGESPISRFEKEPQAASSDHGVNAGLATTVDAIRTSLSTIPTEELSAAVDLLTDTRRTISAIGGRYSGLIANYFLLHLQQVRPGVKTRDDALSLGGADIIDAGKRDVFVIYDFRRYQINTVERARRLAAAGVDIICITDVWLSPVARVSTVVLPTSVRAAGPFDSAAPAFVLTELLINEVLTSLGDRALTRMRQWEEASAYEVHE